MRKTELWRTAAGLVFGLVVGFITSFVLEPSVGFLFGLLAWMVGATVDLTFRVLDLSKIAENTNTIVSDLLATDPVSELRLQFGFRNLARRGAELVEVGKDDVLEFWWACLLRAKSKWSVVTYARPEETWARGWGKESAQNLQEERVRNGCSIERTFLVGSEAELNQLMDSVQHQKDIGISVMWALDSQLQQSELVTSFANRLGTWDVAIVDDRWVYRTNLDSERRIVGASASSHATDVEAARRFLEEVRNAANPI